MNFRSQVSKLISGSHIIVIVLLLLLLPLLAILQYHWLGQLSVSEREQMKTHLNVQAMRLAQELRPDILLLDLGMPRVNGLEVLRWSKAERPASKVIIVTGHTEDAYRQAAETSGADAFLLKKSLGTVLLPTIRRLRGCM